RRPAPVLRLLRPLPLDRSLDRGRGRQRGPPSDDRALPRVELLGPLGRRSRGQRRGGAGARLVLRPEASADGARPELRRGHDIRVVRSAGDLSRLSLDRDRSEEPKPMSQLYSQLPILSIITYLPLLGALLLVLVPKENKNLIMKGATAIAAVDFLLSLPLWWLYQRGSEGFQFVENASWIPSIGVS